MEQGFAFTGFRTPPAPTSYKAIRTAVTEDVVEIALITSFSLIFACILLSSPGIDGVRKRSAKLAKAFIVLYVPLSLLLALFGPSCVGGTIHSETAYKQFTKATIHAKIGIHVGLYSVNITLKGAPVEQINETIDYNERLVFGETEGRLEFGPQGGDLRRGFRSFQIRGSPLPILWIGEYLALDGEQIRWGRQYREAGYYTALLLWMSLASWAIAVVISRWHLNYSLQLTTLTGLAQLLACFTYSVTYAKTGPELAIPFEDAVLRTNYCWGFWLTLVNGILLFGSGLVWLAILSCAPLLLTREVLLSNDTGRHSMAGEDEDTRGRCGKGMFMFSSKLPLFNSSCRSAHVPSEQCWKRISMESCISFPSVSVDREAGWAAAAGCSDDALFGRRPGVETIKEYPPAKDALRGSTTASDVYYPPAISARTRSATADGDYPPAKPPRRRSTTSEVDYRPNEWPAELLSRTSRVDTAEETESCTAFSVSAPGCTFISYQAAHTVLNDSVGNSVYVTDEVPFCNALSSSCTTFEAALNNELPSPPDISAVESNISTAKCGPELSMALLRVAPSESSEHNNSCHNETSLPQLSQDLTQEPVNNQVQRSRSAASI